jgi:hypothetical protein
LDESGLHARRSRPSNLRGRHLFEAGFQPALLLEQRGTGRAAIHMRRRGRL